MVYATSDDSYEQHRQRLLNLNLAKITEYFSAWHDIHHEWLEGLSRLHMSLGETTKYQQQATSKSECSVCSTKWTLAMIPLHTKSWRQHRKDYNTYYHCDYITYLATARWRPDTNNWLIASSLIIMQLWRELRPRTPLDLKPAGDLWPTNFGDLIYDLPTLEKMLETGAVLLSSVERYQLNNIFNFGQWLLLARESFNTAKKTGRLVFWSNNFVDWVEERCKVEKTKVYDYMTCTERFAVFPSILKCRLSVEWFRINGKRVATYLQANTQISRAWQWRHSGIPESFSVVCPGRTDVFVVYH